MWKFACISAVLVGIAAAAERPDLNGTWQLDVSRSQINEDKLKSQTLLIDQKEDSIQITEVRTDSDGKERKQEIQCNTMGQQCQLKDVQVSFYYNGSMLVMMEVRRGKSNVTEKRLRAAEDGKSLTMEVIHVTPAGKAENYSYARQVSAAK